MPEFIRSNLPLIVAVVVLVGVWFVLRTSATRFEGGASIDTLLDSGQPVVLEFFGNT